MKLSNIYNKGRNIFLFSREEESTLIMDVDATYYPYFYELDEDGIFNTIDGKKAKKVFVGEPKDIATVSSKNSYSSDIPFVKKYIIDKIPSIDESPIRYAFLDIEVMTKGKLDIEKADNSISCITYYDSYLKELISFYLGNYSSDKQLLLDLIVYIQKNTPDLLLAWNVDFDYSYISNRCKKYKVDFGKEISPIKEVRFGEGGHFYPAGISILDYMGMYRKYTLGKKRSYTLDFILESEIGKGKKYKNIDFSTLSEEVLLRNREDVEGLVKLEEKNKIIKYFDDIRRLSKCLWEDLPSRLIEKDNKRMWISNNSKIIEMLILEEAKNKNIILPNKVKDRENEDELEGAFRETFDTGLFQNVYKFDLGSAYPTAIVDFTLDIQNLTNIDDANKICIPLISRKDGRLIDTIYVKRNSNTIFPSAIHPLLELKDRRKNELKTSTVGTEEHSKIQISYDSLKSVVNSFFGVIALKSFRLNNISIASCITFLVRDLILYINEKIKDYGYKVIYADTDSVFIVCDKNITDLLNSLVIKWGKDKYDVDVTIKFDFEGIFENLLLLKKCRYFGYINTKKGLKEEIKGIEVKRSDSSKYMAEFQKELIKKILFGKKQEEVNIWIEEEKKRMRTINPFEISLPAKIGMKDYDGKPIFIRAYNNTRLFNKKFSLNAGEIFYYTYIKSIGYDKNNKGLDVYAFSERFPLPKDIEIDFDRMIERNITSKVDNIFEALDWKINTNQLSLI
jgi:DNA polymerase elongation subunit (family B)